MWELTTQKIKTLLESTGLFQNLYSFEPSKISGSPVGTLVPSANDNDYRTTTENTRVYAFMLRLFVNRLSSDDNEQKTEEAMRQLVDASLDILDKNHRLSGLSSRTGYTFLFMEAAPSTWGYAGQSNNMRVAEVIIRVHYSVDVNLIT